MNDNLSFNIEKLKEVYDESNRLYQEYKETIASLDQEIKKLEISWGSKEQSAYANFKEKYDSKKQKLQETENLMKELVDTLNQKRQEIEEATIQSTSNFE